MHHLLAAGTAAIALTVTAAAQSVSITSATRSIETQAFGYDWDFNNGEIDSAASPATAGAFDDSVFVDLDEWYGGHVGTGAASIDSELSASAISAAFDLYASCLDTGVYQADCSSYADLDTAFTAPERVRARVSFEAFCYDDYSMALASLRRVGASGDVVQLQIFGDDDGGVTRTLWLQAGDYACSGEAACWAFGTYATDDDATAVLNVSVRFFHEADYDANGLVDPVDRTAFLAAHKVASLDADFDGDGAVTAADRSQFLASWREHHS